MWRGYNEDWERRKEYLFKTLFRDISPLSTITEEEGTRSKSTLHLSPSSFKAKRKSDAGHRPWSPLPPLIVEREPNRHDEPEEHYQQLGQKMRRLYKWLFIENHSLNSSYDTDESMEEIPIIETLNKTFILDDDDNLEQSLRFSTNFTTGETGPLEQALMSGPTKHDDSNITDDSNDNIIRSTDEYRKTEESFTDDESLPISETIIKSEEQERSGKSVISSHSPEPSDSGGFYQQVTFEAVVHRQAIDQSESSFIRVNEDPGLEIQKRKMDLDESANLERSRISDVAIPEMVETATEYLNVEDIEVMRTPQAVCIRTSYGTAVNQSLQDSTEHLSPTFTSHSMEAEHSYNVLKETSNTIRVEECSDDFNKILESSTPRQSKKRRHNIENISDYNNSTTSIPKRRRYENASVQVSEMMEWNSVRDNFFKGTPKLFRLCSCKNHRCLC